VVVALIGGVAVVVGALIALSGVWLQSWLTKREEHRTRFILDKRELFGKFVACSRIASIEMGKSNRGDLRRMQELGEKLDLDAISALVGEIQLVANDQVVGSAVELLGKLRLIKAFTFQITDHGEDRLYDAVAEYPDLERVFIKAAREELSIQEK